MANMAKMAMTMPELIRAIVDCGFEHPSEVQHECIPQAILGTDVLCQVLTSGVCHGSEDVGDLPHQGIGLSDQARVRTLREILPGALKGGRGEEIKPAVVYGGTPMSKDKEMLKDAETEMMP
eukprot:s1526_g10.t2